MTRLNEWIEFEKRIGKALASLQALRLDMQKLRREMQHEENILNTFKHVKYTVPIIGITGRRGAGKDTYARGLREMLQQLGRPVHFRSFSGGVRRTMEDCDADPESFTIITDVFSNEEAQAIQDRGGHIIRIVRPGVDDQNSGVDDEYVDLIVLNGGTEADLQLQAAAFPSPFWTPKLKRY